MRPATEPNGIDKTLARTLRAAAKRLSGDAALRLDVDVVVVVVVIAAAAADFYLTAAAAQFISANKTLPPLSSNVGSPSTSDPVRATARAIAAPVSVKVVCQFRLRIRSSSRVDRSVVVVVDVVCPSRGQCGHRDRAKERERDR